MVSLISQCRKNPPQSAYYLHRPSMSLPDWDQPAGVSRFVLAHACARRTRLQRSAFQGLMNNSVARCRRIRLVLSPQREQKRKHCVGANRLPLRSKQKSKESAIGDNVTGRQIEWLTVALVQPIKCYQTSIYAHNFLQHFLSWRLQVEKEVYYVYYMF